MYISLLLLSVVINYLNYLSTVFVILSMYVCTYVGIAYTFYIFSVYMYVEVGGVVVAAGQSPPCCSAPGVQETLPFNSYVHRVSG